MNDSAVSRVFLVDDHAFVSLGVKDYLERQEGIEVIGAAIDVRGALEFLENNDVDVAVIDLVIGSDDGLALVKQVHALHPGLSILVLSMHDERIYAERAIRAGALGYVMKGEAPEVLVEAVRTVRRGDLYLSESASTASDVRRSQAPRSEGRDPLTTLSDRELTVFRWLGDGRSSREIAEALHISLKTVHTYRERIKTKLGLDSAVQLVHRAVIFSRGDSTEEGSAST